MSDLLEIFVQHLTILLGIFVECAGQADQLFVFEQAHNFDIDLLAIQGL